MVDIKTDWISEFDETDKFLLISASKSIQHFLFRNGCEELKINSENIATTNEGMTVNNEKTEIYFKLV